MKIALIFFLIFNACNVFADNEIIAEVNNTPISLQSIKTKLLNNNSNEKFIEALSFEIDTILQLQKAEELNIEASIDDVNLAIINIAKDNNITMNQLKAFPEFLSLKEDISEKISILNLQRYITRDISISKNDILNSCSKDSTDKGIKQIKIAQIIISEVKMKAEKNKEKAIKSFLKRLSEHVSKGASFESFAKLHSQHPSYSNGGVTGWIDVDTPITMMLDSLKDTEISKIYLTDFGFAIGVKLEERLVSSNLKQCKEKLTYLNAEKFYFNWVKNLREDAYIKIYHDKL